MSISNLVKEDATSENNEELIFGLIIPFVAMANKMAHLASGLLLVTNLNDSEDLPFVFPCNRPLLYGLEVAQGEYILFEPIVPIAIELAKYMLQEPTSICLLSNSPHELTNSNGAELQNLLVKEAYRVNWGPVMTPSTQFSLGEGIFALSQLGLPAPMEIDIDSTNWQNTFPFTFLAIMLPNPDEEIEDSVMCELDASTTLDITMSSPGPDDVEMFPPLDTCSIFPVRAPN
ncbi:hypothetical protein CTheo_6367 [Ceratobasidium theobromae]|uniref:Uncharacterized protein n=1 Tax=Ceratobasidium theobromae TaxID=1582974 RepID=A0A5N5QFF3_9AGAM|nr:hypothetical protein CTheo_6367 [Ceratobasidium theobromae]